MIAVLACLVMAIIQGGSQGWTSPLILGLFIGAVVCLAAHKHDPRRSDQGAQQQVHQQKMPETVDAKGHLEAILRVSCPGSDSQTCITHDRMQRGQVSDPGLAGDE